MNTTGHLIYPVLSINYGHIIHLWNPVYKTKPVGKYLLCCDPIDFSLSTVIANNV